MIGAGRAHRRAKRKPPPKVTQPGIMPAERRMLLRSFSDESINAELDRRLLSAFTVEELETEAARRGIR